MGVAPDVTESIYRFRSTALVKGESMAILWRDDVVRIIVTLQDMVNLFT